MATWNTAEQIIAAHKMHDPPNEVMRGDGKFPYRPDIACPRPQRKYEAQIALENMEKQATTTAPVLAKWRLEALASRAQSHFAHLRSPVAVANCVLCRTSTVGCAVLGWALTVTSTNPTATYPINSPTSTPTFRTPDCPNDSSIGNTTAVTSNTSPGSNVRSQTMCCNDLWAPATRQPLLPDRDAVTTNAWHGACNASPGASLEDEEERILWPRGVCSYEYGGLRHY